MYLPSSSPLILNNTAIDPDADTFSGSSIGMIALQIYAFGGLAFMIGLVIYCLGFWVWTVVIKREWANSPPELELHPERMREKERARQERLKRKKEEKLQRRRGTKPEEKFTPPPIRYNQKPRPRTTSILKTSNRPVKNASFSASPPKGLRVSWASSAATLDVDGHASEKLIETGSINSLPSIKFPFDAKSIASGIDIPTPARTAIPHLSASIEPRAPHGDEMIAVTTPGICESWSKPSDPFLVCRCWDSVGPLEKRNFAGCDIHRYRD